MKKIEPVFPRVKMVGIKLTEEEFKKVDKICKEVGVTKSRFFRHLLNEYLKNEK